MNFSSIPYLASLILLASTLGSGAMYFREVAKSERLSSQIQTLTLNVSTLGSSLKNCSASVDAAKKEAEAASAKAQAALEQAKKDTKPLAEVAIKYVYLKSDSYKPSDKSLPEEVATCRATDALLRQAIQERHNESN